MKCCGKRMINIELVTSTKTHTIYLVQCSLCLRRAKEVTLKAKKERTK